MATVASGQSADGLAHQFQTPVIPIASFIPQDSSVLVYRRFISHFEPDEYGSGWADESLSGKTDVFLGDWSQLIKIRVTGEEAQAFFEWISTNRWLKFRPGQAKQAVYCNDDGQVVGDGLLLCIAEKDFIFTDGPGTAWAIFQFYSGRKKFDATLQNVTDDIGVLQVQGPKSVPLLEELTAGNPGIRDIKFNEWKQTSLLGCDVRILRNGISGELGFEIWADKKDCPGIYTGVLQHGQKYHIRELGGRAKMVHHVEAAFATPTVDYINACLGEGQELEAYREFLRGVGLNLRYWSRVAGSYTKDNKELQLSPYELGWGWLVSFDHDCIGKEALQKIKQSGPKKQISLVWNKEDCIDVYASLLREETYEQMDLPRSNGSLLVASTVRKDGKAIGFATSRCYSSYFKEMLSLGVVPAEHSAQGTEVEIVWGEEGKPQKIIRAVVHPAPYKEDKRRTPI